MCTAAETAAPASTGQALAMVRAGLGYLAGCDAASLGTAAQAEALIGLEHAEAQHTAARAKILAAFTAQQGYEADGHYGAASWLRAITRVTKGGAAAATGWARRLGGHPVIAAALAQGQLPASLARLICDWTDQLPAEYRADADGILLAAVRGGADQHDLARLAREMLDRARTSPDRDTDGFEDRALWLGTTFGGAGRLHADLTPACAAALTVVLDALGQKAGPEDTRSAAQRRHDAVEEACRRLIGGRMIPGRDGQPPHLTVHIDLNDLRGGSVLERSWTPAKAAAGPGAAYLTGAAAEAAACDAVLTPMVTGQIDWQVLDQLTTVWLTAHGHAHTAGPPERPPGRTTGRPGGRPAGRPCARAAGRPGRRPAGRPRGRAAGRPCGRPTGRPPGRAAGRPRRRAAGRPPRTDGRKAATRTSQPPAPATPRAPAPVPGPSAPRPRPRPRPRRGHHCHHRRRGRPGLRNSRLPGGHPAAAAGHHPALEPRPAVRARRARLPAARHPARRPLQHPQPAPGPRPHHPHHPTPPAHRRHPARPALSVSRLHPATVGLRRAPPDPVGERRPHQPGKPPTAVQVSPPHRDPSMGLDDHLPPRRHPHRHRTRRTHPPLPRTTPASRLTGGRTPHQAQRHLGPTETPPRASCDDVPD